MRGAWFSTRLIALTLLAGIPSVCFANEGYDQNLERAIKEIVARKIEGDMRGTLNNEWDPQPLQSRSAQEPKPKRLAPEPLPGSDTGSIVHVDPPAIVLSALNAAMAMLEPYMPKRKVRIVYQ